ncbi:MAG: multiheme c-type cytochrome [Acidobacteriota bacterium]
MPVRGIHSSRKLEEIGSKQPQRSSLHIPALVTTGAALPALLLAWWAADASATSPWRHNQPATATTAISQVKGVNPRAQAYVGSRACASCHEEIFQQWQQSAHNHTIDTTSAGRVLGLFVDPGDRDPPTVTGPTYPRPTGQGGAPQVTVTLRRSEGRYWAVFDDADAFIKANFKPTASGRYAFSLDYTQGKLFYQTYMTRMPNGEVYITPVLWDRFEKTWRLAGWRPWGSACAHCHVTGLKLQTDPEGSAGISPYSRPSQFVARPVDWLEMAVGCEICHGGGAAHVAAPTAANIVNPARLSHRAQIDLCGSCHGLGVSNAQTYRLGDPVDPPLSNAEVAPGSRVNGFWPTGQHKTYFSLYQGHLKSRHWQGAHLTCAPCHRAHSSGTRYPVEDNSQCTLCHTGYKRRLSAHTHHTPDSPGSRCIECHMPRNNRFTLVPGVVLMTHVNSHNMSLPDPRVNLDYGVPDACTQCHASEGAAWALEQLERLWGPPGK